MKEKIWFWSSLKQSLSYYLFSSNCTFSIFKTYKNAAFTASHRFCIQNFIYTLSRETRILKITKKYYYQACKLLPYSCLISQEVRRKQSLHCCEKQYLYKNRFFFFLYANRCGITHVWTFIFKSCHSLVSLVLPNILQETSWQELTHFISVKRRKINLHTISLALSPTYRYHKHVMMI